MSSYQLNIKMGTDRNPQFNIVIFKINTSYQICFKFILNRHHDLEIGK